MRNGSTLLIRESPDWKNPLAEVAIASLEVDIVVSIVGEEDLPETSNDETTQAARIIATTFVTSPIGDVAVVVALQQQMPKTTQALGKTKPRARIQQATTSVRTAQMTAQTLTRTTTENDCTCIICTLRSQRKNPVTPQSVCAKAKTKKQNKNSKKKKTNKNKMAHSW